MTGSQHFATTAVRAYSSMGAGASDKMNFAGVRLWGLPCTYQGNEGHYHSKPQQVCPGVPGADHLKGRFLFAGDRD